MKSIKIFLTIALAFFTLSMANATHKTSKAIINQVSENLISVKAELCDLDQMRVEITNKKGDVVFSDNLINQSGFAKKTYDFSDTKIGEYYVTVYCNNQILEATIISDGKVSMNDSHYFVLN
jgi:hypothetical protein